MIGENSKSLSAKQEITGKAAAHVTGIHPEKGL